MPPVWEAWIGEVDTVGLCVGQRVMALDRSDQVIGGCSHAKRKKEKRSKPDSSFETVIDAPTKWHVISVRRSQDAYIGRHIVANKVSLPLSARWPPQVG